MMALDDRPPPSHLSSCYQRPSFSSSSTDSFQLFFPANTPSNSLEAPRYRQRGSHKKRNNPKLRARRYCPQLHASDDLVKVLGLEKRLLSENRCCYCRYCALSAGYNEKYIFSRGVPNSRASLPLGWTRYPVKMSPEANARSATWHIAYHGTTRTGLFGILRDGALRIPDNQSVFVRDGHILGQYYTFTSPSTTYAGFGLYASPFQVEGDVRYWQVMVEILQQPFSYSKERETSGLGDRRFDPHFLNNEVEWKSNLPNCTVVRSVLLREVPFVEPHMRNTTTPDAAALYGMYFWNEDRLWYQPFNGAPPYIPLLPHPSPWNAAAPSCGFLNDRKNKTRSRVKKFSTVRFMTNTSINNDNCMSIALTTTDSCTTTTGNNPRHVTSPITSLGAKETPTGPLLSSNSILPTASVPPSLVPFMPFSSLPPVSSPCRHHAALFTFPFSYGEHQHYRPHHSTETSSPSFPLTYFSYLPPANQQPPLPITSLSSSSSNACLPLLPLPPRQSLLLRPSISMKHTSKQR